MPHDEVAAMQRRLWSLVAQAQRMGEVYLTNEAMQEWNAVYKELSAETPGLTGAIVNRAEAQTMRLALVYALLDGKKSIDTPHINSALALWRYASTSADALFCDRGADSTEQKILAVLKAGPCSRALLNRALSGHTASAKIRSAISSMLAANKVSVTVEKTGGRSSQIITLSADNAE
jgi:hypothetical protein